MIVVSLDGSSGVSIAKAVGVGFVDSVGRLYKGIPAGAETCYGFIDTLRTGTVDGEIVGIRFDANQSVQDRLKGPLARVSGVRFYDQHIDVAWGSRFDGVVCPSEQILEEWQFVEGPTGLALVMEGLLAVCCEREAPGVSGPLAWSLRRLDRRYWEDWGEAPYIPTHMRTSAEEAESIELEKALDDQVAKYAGVTEL